MEEQLRQDILTACEARAGFYRFLANVFLWEPTDEQIEAMATANFPSEGGDIGRGYSLIAEFLHHRDTGTRQQIAVDYAHVFLGAGNYDKIMAPPYESVYTSEERILMQEARDGALAYYRREGLDLPADNTTPEDHLGFEMQFMATLIERCADALRAGDGDRFAELVGIQRSFFDEHLANWLPAFSHDIDTHCKTDYYHGVALLVRGLLAEEAEVLTDLEGCLAQA